MTIVYGNIGMERPNAEADYGNAAVKDPACLIMMEGADYGHGRGHGMEWLLCSSVQMAFRRRGL